MALAGGQRRGEIGFWRFLRNPAVTVAGLGEAAARHTAQRVSGREVLAIQDTSEISLGGRKKRDEGYGAVGKGGCSGVLMHPVLAVDAASGELFGLADIAVWNRDGGKALPHGQRAGDDKESRRWLTGIGRAADVLKQATQVTVVADREGDIYQDFALRPEGVHLLVRAGFDRRLATGGKLFDHAAALAEAARFTVNIPAAPFHPQRDVPDVKPPWLCALVPSQSCGPITGFPRTSANGCRQALACILSTSVKWVPRKAVPRSIGGC